MSTLFVYSLFLLCHITSGLSDNPSVIIVGAGAAGIAAATKLLENSITNITILEAQNRIGGRVNTVKFGDGVIDLGAEYVDGEKGNIVYELAKDFNILEPGVPLLQKNVYYSNGSVLDNSLIREMTEEILNHQIHTSEGFNTTGRSVGDLFIYRYNLKLLKKYENDKNKLKIVKEGLRFTEGYVNLQEGSFSWFDTSLDNDYLKCEGKGLVWKGIGFKTLFEILMKSYPDPSKKLPVEDKLRLNSKVVRINWQSSDKITVVTSDNITYSADYVIFTPSVGVLNQRKNYIFNPLLPPSKHQATYAMTFAGVIRIFLHFPTKWWKNDDRAFSFFWSDEDIKSTDFSEGPSKNGVSWITQIRDISQVPHNPNVWEGWITGDLVPKIEYLSLKTLKSGSEYVLNKFLGKSYNVTKIDKIIRSDWCSNKNFLGTYSNIKTKFYKKGLSFQAILAEPLGTFEGKLQLLFAGEATNPIHYGSVHGAIETGFREANRIIKLHNK